ncbi:MAG: DUF4167 domain-containing protein [Paracoccus sp. (in: a-proteobacteria)]|uniref:DUF4167 domain-containing protein n=1 Tax=Paracoccus sp. TaxID=267 RepID=UPI0026DFB07E|nr:DUF4167 domain-containing protein [Paracoccus sp. (in: a-proteobacteria)]MDO5621146.1 DUF4167 domain-containing protein [Paracoccus sp. (in: a-proteobacteria)]
MRSSKSRSRNKSNRQRSLGNIVNRVFDSSGPEGKVRGTPQQIIDKYLTLARDAQLSGDRVAEQSFLQHAEHYTRMLGEAQREQAERQAQFQQHQQNRDDRASQDDSAEDADDSAAPDRAASDRAEREDRREPRREDRSRDERREDRPAAAQEDHGQDALPLAHDVADVGPVATPEDAGSKPAPRRRTATRNPATRSRSKRSDEVDEAPAEPLAENG